MNRARGNIGVIKSTKLPPYGRDVTSNPGNVFIYAGGNAWSAARRRAACVGKNSVLVLPPIDDFRDYHWPVNGLRVVLVWPDGEIRSVRNFGIHLIESGALLVVAPHKDDPDGGIFFRPARRAAA